MGIRVFSGGGGGTSFTGGTLDTALLFTPDNTIDIGAAGATRPRTVYIGTSAVIGSAGSLAGAAANVLELRSGATAQEFRVYNTHTSSTDYEAIRLYWNANVMRVEADKGSGGGTYRSMAFRVGGFDAMTLSSTSLSTISIISNSHYAATSNDDIGRTTGGGPWRNLVLYNSQQGGGTKALTESVATGFVTLTTATNDRIGGYIRYVIEATDGTNLQARSGLLKFAVVDKAGTAVVVLSADTAEAVVETAGGSTLTNTFDTSVTGHVTTIRATAVSSLAQTALNIKYFVNVSNTTTVTQL